MRTIISSFSKRLLLSIIYWTLVMFLYAIFRFYGTKSFFNLPESRSIVELIYSSPVIFLSLMGFFLGLLYAFSDALLEKFVLKRTILGFYIVLRSFSYILITALVATIVIFLAFDSVGESKSLSPLWWLKDKLFWSIQIYIVVASFGLSFLYLASERFGKGIFLKVLIGVYSKPKEEERIFMFLDLKNSTSIAEKLGHYRYSKFIQDCFFDLNKVVNKYSAEIYQYVGDEAVLSWQYKKGIANNNCIGVFFAFEAQRKSREDYYIKNYGIFPEFKAGLHGGTLMAAEVGFVKKELAYHGDVINTSARIQAECNKHNVTLLLSEKIFKELRINLLTETKSLGNIILRGKQKEVKIHSIIKL